MLVQKCDPIGPILPPCVIERRMATLVFGQQHLRRGTNEQFHTVVIWRSRRPTDVVHRRSTHVIFDTWRHPCLVNEELDRLSKAPPAGRVKHAFAEAIRCVHGMTGFEERAECVDVVGLHGIHLVWRIRQEVLLIEGYVVGVVLHPLGGIGDDVLPLYCPGNAPRLKHYRVNKVGRTDTQVKLVVR